MTLSTATPIFRKTSLEHGLEADLPPNPRPGDVYIATDTQRQFIAFEAGVWTLASPLTVDENSNLDFDGNPLFTNGIARNASFPNGGTQLSGIFGLMTNVRLSPNVTMGRITAILSTSPTAAGLAEDNILAATMRFGNSTNFPFFSFNGIIDIGSAYFYRSPSALINTFDDVLQNLNTFGTNPANIFGQIDWNTPEFVRSAVVL